MSHLESQLAQEFVAALRRCVALCVAVIMLLGTLSAHASPQWLAAQLRADGSIATDGDVANPSQSTAEAVRTIRLLLGNSVALQSADSYLSSQSYRNTELLAQLIELQVQKGIPAAALAAELFPHQNADGGFGEFGGYQSNSLDTALALTALFDAGYTTTSQNLAALNYLISAQNADGGWAIGANDTSVYVSAYATQAVWQFRHLLPAAATSAARGKAFLLAKRQSNNAWDSDFESALALIALAPQQTIEGELNASIAPLNAHRSQDGSWGGDVYTTALALRAITAASVPNPNPDLARISGVVVDGQSLAPISGVSVQLTGASATNATADSQGQFAIAGLTAGAYSLSVNAAGYPPLSGSFTLKGGQSLDLGVIHLLRDGQLSVARIEGVVTDDSGNALSGALVTVSGLAPAHTDTQGRYLINDVPPGSVSIVASNTGYFSAQGTTVLVAGSTVNFSPQLRRLQTAGVSVIGTFRDAVSSQVLAGVQVTIDGAAHATTQSNSSGSISLSNLSPGELHIQVQLAGYLVQSAIVTVDGGQTLDLSGALTPIAPDAPPTFSLSGRITDAVTHLPITGANVSLSGAASIAVLSDNEGNYSFTSLPAGDFNVVVSAVGYNDAHATSTGSPYQAIDFSPTLTASGQQPTGFHAIVTDAVTGHPLEGASVTLGSSTAITAPGGEVLFRNLDATSTTVTFRAVGYQPLSLSISLVQGFINDAGTIQLTPDAQAVQVSLSGRLLDSITNSPLVGATVTATGLSGTQAFTTDAQGHFGFTATSGDAIEIEFAAANHVNSSFTWIVTTENQDLGQVRLRPEGLDTLLPDLAMESVDATTVSTTGDDYRVNGTVTFAIRNRGYVPVVAGTDFVAYEDLNGNQKVDDNEPVLGRATLSSELAAGELRSIPISLSGTMAFRDAPISVFADAAQAVVERSEENNNGVSIGKCVAIPPAASALAPTLKWRWAGSPQVPSDNQVFGPVMVAQMTDDNGDGRIDTHDVPDLIFTTVGQRLTVISGDDGHTIWQTAPNMVTGWGSPAVADIDGDGLNEIVVSNAARTQLLAFENDGRLKWSVPNGPTHADMTRDGITIADLDGDGKPEIITGRRVYSNTGALLHEGTGDYGGIISYGTLPIAADIDRDGKKEVIAGRTAYRADGSILWNQTSAIGDGFTAIGNFDGDDFPEIVLVTTGYVYLLDHTGAIKWGPVALPGSAGRGGAPTVGDFDGDGKPEIGIAGASFYTVLETDGSVKWSSPTTDPSSAVTGSSLFDFDGDGRTEVVYADEINLHIYEGATGKELYRIPNASGTTLEYPVIADVDGDGRAELVVASNQGNLPGVRVFEGGQGEWMPTRAIWNESAYHIDNINDDGSVPPVEAEGWRTHNSYRANAAITRQAEPVADLTAGALRLIDHGVGQPSSLTVRVGNAGAPLNAGEATVAFYDGSPTANGKLLGSTLIPALASGAYADVQLDGISAVSAGGTLYAVVDSTHRITECNENNNTSSTPGRPTLGGLGVSTDSSVYAPGSTVAIHTAVTNTGLFTSTYSVESNVKDVEGNVVTTLPPITVTSLASAASQAFDSSMSTSGLLAGTYRIDARLLDLNGNVLATASSIFAIQHDGSSGPAASLRVTTDRPAYNTSDAVSIEALARNLTVATLVNDAQVHLTVTNAQGVAALDTSIDAGVLAPGSTKDLQQTLRLNRALEGTYSVTGTLLDASGQLLASGSTTFIVVNDPLVAITGRVTVASTNVSAGEALLCSRTTSNQGTQLISALGLRYLVVSITDQRIVSDQQLNLDVAAGASHTDMNSIATAGYSSGDYACVLQANIGGTWRNLAYANFNVTAPPIRIDTQVTIGNRGRVLVLVDKPASSKDATDPFSSCDVPDLNVQLAHIKSVLTQAGWSYTIVQTASDFDREFHTGGYEVYAIFSEEVKLAVSLQDEVVNAVHNGAGLLVAGNHDRRNSKLETALGIQSLGKNLSVTSLVVSASDVMPAGEEKITVDADVLEMKLQGATAFGRYRLTSPKNNVETAAATKYAYGDGKSVYVGFDLIMAGAASGDDSLFAQVFTHALSYVHPEVITPIANHVLPLRIALTNQGIATSGRVLLKLPTGVAAIDRGSATVLSDGTLAWTYTLTANQVITLPTLYVKLPTQPGDVNFRVQVQTGTSPNFVDYGDKTLTVRVTLQ